MATVPTLAAELEREPGAALAAPPVPERQDLPEPARVIPFPSRLASLPTPQRASALAGMQRGDGNAAVARMLSATERPGPPMLARAGGRCKCGGTIGPDGQCDKCRAMRGAGLEPPAEAESAGDGAIARMLAGTVLQRQGRDDETEGGAEPPCQGAACKIPSECVEPFCCPYPTGTAYIIREQIRTPFLLAIGSQVTASVVPVWLMWFNGGVGMQNFSGRFGADFAGDLRTAYLSGVLAGDVAASVDATKLQQLAATATPGAPVSLLPTLPASYATTKTAALETEDGPMEMNFTTIGTPPGNLAGGVGKTQTACPVGATPGGVDDQRVLTDVQGTLVRNPDGSITRHADAALQGGRHGRPLPGQLRLPHGHDQRAARHLPDVAPGGQRRQRRRPVHRRVHQHAGAVPRPAARAAGAAARDRLRHHAVRLRRPRPPGPAARTRSSPSSATARRTRTSRSRSRSRATPTARAPTRPTSRCRSAAPRPSSACSSAATRTSPAISSRSASARPARSPPTTSTGSTTLPAARRTAA